MTLKIRIDLIKTAVNNWLSSEKGKFFVKAGEYCINGLMLILLLWQLYSIGFVNILKAFPSQPLFYLLFIVIFITLPVAELFTYRQYWHLPNRSLLPIFIKKRIYNNSFIGYSGEVYLSVELKKRFNIAGRELFDAIRDNNILSSVASTFFAISVLLIYLYFGEPLPLGWNGVHLEVVALGFIAVLLFFLILPGKIRRYIFNSGLKQSSSIFGIHFGRLLFLVAIQIWQWDIVISSVALSAWITLAAIQIVTSRLPFIPNRDLLFIIASVQLSSGLQIPADALAALLLVHTVLDKIVSLILFSLISYFQAAQK